MTTIYLPATAGSFAWIGEFVTPGFGGRPVADHLRVWRTPIIAWSYDPDAEIRIAEPVFAEEIFFATDPDTFVLLPAGEGWFVGHEEHYRPPDALERWQQAILYRRQTDWDKAQAEEERRVASQQKP